MANVIVTGGSRGLGLGIVRRLSAAGYNVIAIARNETEQLRQVRQEAQSCQHGVVHFTAFDLADIAAIPTLVKSARREFGTIAGLVNNAGIGTSGLLATMPDPQIAQVVNLNVISLITLTKYVVRRMMADRTGRIINIASVVAFTGYQGLSAYSATKASLLGFTRSLARELGPLGITVNAVAPGFVATDMTHILGEQQREQLVRRSALRRLAEVEDVAQAVDFLLSDKARNITGTVMTVDAGGAA